MRRGRVVDPANNFDDIADVVIDRGRIVRVTDGPLPDAKRVIDADGMIVTPGLIDMHVHCFTGLSSYGLDPDRIGITAGCAHVNDMGSSGCFTVNAFRHWVARTATTGVTCFMNMLGFGVPENWGVAATGLGEQSVSVPESIVQAQANPTLVRGIKVHCEPGEMSWWGDKTFDGALEVANACGLPIYAHLGYLFPEKPGAPRRDPDSMLDDVLERLRPGDVIGHAFSGHLGALIMANGSVHPRATELSARGLLLEVGYGLATTFHAIRMLLDAGLQPDLISSDVHGITLGRPRTQHDHGDLAYTQVGTMTKFWTLGMPLSKVVHAATVAPAKLLGIDHNRGSLTPGMRADITILDPRAGNFELSDNAGAKLRADRVLVPTHTIKDGVVHVLDAMQMPEFRYEYATAALRVEGLQPAKRIENCARIVSGNWWQSRKAQSA